MNPTIENIRSPKKTDDDPTMVGYYDIRVGPILLRSMKVFRGGMTKWGLRIKPPHNGKFDSYVIEEPLYSKVMDLIKEDIK